MEKLYCTIKLMNIGQISQNIILINISRKFYRSAVIAALELYLVWKVLAYMF